MYEFQGIDFGPTEVTVEDDTLRGALDQMGQLYNLHKDALFLAHHVRFFYDEDPEVVPRSRDDAEGYQYRGFECLRTGCNITFKEKEEKDGIFPGRYCAYVNGDDNPKLYDPARSPDEILEKVAPDTPFIRKFGVNLGEDRSSEAGPPPRGKRAGGSSSAANPSGDPSTSGTKARHESEDLYSGGNGKVEKAGEQLVRKARKNTAPDALARDVQVDGTPLPSKIEAFASFAGRDSGYLRRCLDAVGVQSATHVAVGELGDLVEMLIDEQTLNANESFEPDDELPF